MGEKEIVYATLGIMAILIIVCLIIFILFDYVKTLKPKPINELDIVEKNNYKRQLINYPIGSKVIIKSSNRNEPYLIGVIKDYVPISMAKNMTPLITIDDKDFICFGILRHYSKTLCSILNKLTPIEQWNVLAEFYIIDDKNNN